MGKLAQPVKRVLRRCGEGLVTSCAFVYRLLGDWSSRVVVAVAVGFDLSLWRSPTLHWYCISPGNCRTNVPVVAVCRIQQNLNSYKCQQLFSHHHSFALTRGKETHVSTAYTSYTNPRGAVLLWRASLGSQCRRRAIPAWSLLLPYLAITTTLERKAGLFRGHGCCRTHNSVCSSIDQAKDS